jgi:DNA (cytosine-5)-methyltransferase 1
MSKQLTAISLFSGAGGDTLGMKNAGINVTGYVEFDKDAISTHETNFPDCKLIGEDITKIPNEDFEKYTDKTDIMFGGFPCQSFSHGGKKDPKDTRGFLYKEFVRTVKIINPKIIIGENVKGLLSRKMEDGRLFIETIIEEFSDLGYDIKYNLFNMKNYGIPQSRERILIYGIRHDIEINMNLSNIEELSPKYNKDILEFSMEDAIKIENKEILKIIPDNKFIYKENNVDEPYGKPPTNLNKCYQNSELSFKTRAKPTYSAIIDKDDIARTILCSYGRMPRLFVPVKNNLGCFLRPYTIKELQQIQGFPKSYIIEGNYISQVKQIGNAVPPLFIQHVMYYIQGILAGDIIEI